MVGTCTGNWTQLRLDLANFSHIARSSPHFHVNLLLPTFQPMICSKRPCLHVSATSSTPREFSHISTSQSTPLSASPDRSPVSTRQNTIYQHPHHNTPLINCHKHELNRIHPLYTINLSDPLPLHHCSCWNALYRSRTYPLGLSGKKSV